jgi:hypothetical protein
MILVSIYLAEISLWNVAFSKLIHSAKIAHDFNDPALRFFRLSSFAQLLLQRSRDDLKPCQSELCNLRCSATYIGTPAVWVKPEATDDPQVGQPKEL